MDGFSILEKFDKFGMRGLDICELVFENCEVLVENVFGLFNDGVGVFMSGLDYECVVFVGGLFGIM